MAHEVSGFITNRSGMLLEPCAGIGGLIQPLYHHIKQDGLWVVAYELDPEAFEIGRRLFPLVEWHLASPFDEWEQLQGYFDTVLMNPPFSVLFGTSSGDRMVDGRCKKSEHMFLELALRALKPGNDAHVVAPYSYVDRVPKKERAWMSQYMDSFTDRCELDGEFNHTKIKVNHWIIHRNDEPIDGDTNFDRLSRMLTKTREQAEETSEQLSQLVEQVSQPKPKPAPEQLRLF
jgi:hypothetical protein